MALGWFKSFGKQSPEPLSEFWAKADELAKTDPVLAAALKGDSDADTPSTQSKVLRRKRSLIRPLFPGKGHPPPSLSAQYLAEIARRSIRIVQSDAFLTVSIKPTTAREVAMASRAQQINRIVLPKYIYDNHALDETMEEVRDKMPPLKNEDQDEIVKTVQGYLDTARVGCEGQARRVLISSQGSQSNGEVPFMLQAEIGSHYKEEMRYLLLLLGHALQAQDQEGHKTTVPMEAAALVADLISHLLKNAAKLRGQKLPAVEDIEWMVRRRKMYLEVDKQLARLP